MASMLTDPEVLQHVGLDFSTKVARVVVGCTFYGFYLLLVYFLLVIFLRQHGFPGSRFVWVATVLLFLGCTLFLCLDIADLAARIQYIMIDNPQQTVAERLASADERLKKLVWTGYTLFVFMLALADSVILWRTWKLFQDAKIYLIPPILTLLGSLACAIFELGCHLKTHWAIDDLSPTAGSVGAQQCKDADLASYTLSFATNIICTCLIAWKAWQHRRIVNTYLGTLRRRTQAEKIMVLLVESGAAYLVLYALQAIPIYNHYSLPREATLVFNIINAIIQQAMGLYPTAIIVVVQLQLSLWDAPPVSTGVFTSADNGMRFQSGPETATTNTAGTGTVGMSSLSSRDPAISMSPMVSPTSPEKEKARLIQHEYPPKSIV